MKVSSRAAFPPLSSNPPFPLLSNRPVPLHPLLPPCSHDQITTEKQQQGYIDSTIEGGLKGAAVAAGVLVPATMILRKQSAYFRALPLPLKALGAVSVIVPAITISAEKAGEAYSRTQWTGIGKQEIEAVQRREQERWEKLGTWGQVGDWAKRRKWAIIGTA